MPLFCGEAVVSYRVANVAELERKTNPTFLLRFVSLRFPLLRFHFVLLRFASCYFVLLRFASASGSGLGSFCLVFDLFYLILLRFALLRSNFLLRFASLWSAVFCSASFRSARFCLAFALFCFVSLCLRFVLLRFDGIFLVLLRFAS